MATFTIQKQQMSAGASRETNEVVVPSGLTSILIELNMTPQEAKDPSMHVLAEVFYFDERIDSATGQPRGWRRIGFTEVIGSPSNNFQNLPNVTFGEADCQFLAGKRMKGKITAHSDGNYGATVRTT